MKRKAPQVLVLAISAIVVAIVLLDTLEDTVTEGGTPSGTPVAMLLNAALSITKDVTAIVASSGYAGIFLLMFLESSSLPIPSEVILPFAGYLASTGQLNIWLTIVVSTIAGLSGSLIDYYVGMKGTSLLGQQRALKNLLYDEGKIDAAKKWFTRYGEPAVFLSRLIPGFRTLISFPAGAVKMNLGKFILFTVAGCLIWNTALIYLGVYVGANWREIRSGAHYLIIGVAAVLILLTVYVIKGRKRTQK